MGLDNLLIHIGYHKTGTTWLQRELFVREHPVFEPLSRGNKKQSNLCRHFVMDDEAYLLNPSSPASPNYKKEMNYILEKHPAGKDKIWVLSNERFSGNPHGGGFDSQSIARRLKEEFPEAKVLIIIREQKSFLLSNYFQYLSIGGDRGLDQYLSQKYDGKNSSFSPNHIKYHHLITKYYELFGADHVLVLPYEVFAQNKPLFFDKMGAFLGRTIQLPGEASNKFHNRKRNFYLNYKLRILHAMTRPGSVNRYNKVNRTRRRLYHWGFYLGEKVVPASWDKWILDKSKEKITSWCDGRFEESNVKTSELIKINLKEWGYA
ncbi:MAG: sulfotransferase domain-containing protein [Bacteroidota bacterium]